MAEMIKKKFEMILKNWAKCGIILAFLRIISVPAAKGTRGRLKPGVEPVEPPDRVEVHPQPGYPEEHDADVHDEEDSYECQPDLSDYVDHVGVWLPGASFSFSGFFLVSVAGKGEGASANHGQFN